MKKEQLRQELLMHWNIQEHLLQSYRSLFLVSQSLLFATAVVITSCKENDLVLFILLLFIGMVELRFWYTICRARANDVSYFQWKIMESESLDPDGISEKETAVLTAFKAWQAMALNEKVKLLTGRKLYKSQTRIKMEKGLPFLFLISWIALGFIFFCSVYFN